MPAPPKGTLLDELGIPPVPTATLEHVLVQRYIHNPFLLSNHKFDFRCFVTIASLSPLRVFIHHHGWANVADSPFLKDELTSHVTNAAFVEHKDKSQVECAASDLTWPLFRGPVVVERSCAVSVCSASAANSPWATCLTPLPAVAGKRWR